MAFLNPAIKLLFNAGFKFLKPMVPSPLPIPGSTCATYAASAQGASIGSATLFPAAVGPALYEINYYIVVTQAATTSSSIVATWSWTDDKGAQTFATTTPANTLGAFAQGTFILQSVKNVAVSFSTTYASSGATSMQYSIYIGMTRMA